MILGNLTNHAQKRKKSIVIRVLFLIDLFYKNCQTFLQSPHEILLRFCKTCHIYIFKSINVVLHTKFHSHKFLALVNVDDSYETVILIGNFGIENVSGEKEVVAWRCSAKTVFKKFLKICRKTP